MPRLPYFMYKINESSLWQKKIIHGVPTDAALICSVNGEVPRTIFDVVIVIRLSVTDHN